MEIKHYIKLGVVTLASLILLIFVLFSNLIWDYFWDKPFLFSIIIGLSIAQFILIPSFYLLHLSEKYEDDTK